MAELKVNLLTENFTLKEGKGKSEGVSISGFALPFDKTSRNGFSYRKESVIKNYKTLEGKPMFFNHNIESLPIGKVKSVEVTEGGMYYEAELMPVTEEEKAIVEKVKKGLLDKVSIQCIYENPNMNEESGAFEVDVKEFLELSLVGVPGFEDTTLQAHESLKKEMSIKMAKEEIKKAIEMEQEDPSNQDDGEKQDDIVSRAEFEELMTRVSVLESRVDELSKEDEDEQESEEATSDDENTDEEEDKEKTENFKRKTVDSVKKVTIKSAEERRFERLLNY